MKSWSEEHFVACEGGFGPHLSLSLRAAGGTMAKKRALSQQQQLARQKGRPKKSRRLHQVCAPMFLSLSLSCCMLNTGLQIQVRERETSRMASRQTPLYTLCVTEFHRKRKEFQPISTTGINEISPACLDDVVKIMSHFKEDHHFA